MNIHFMSLITFDPQDNYNMFGVTFHADDQIVRPLEDQGLRRLYPHNYDHRRELKKLNHSIVINFLDLLDILIKLPDSPKRTEKMDDLTLLFIHIHHLINEFRPHQVSRCKSDVSYRYTSLFPLLHDEWCGPPCCFSKPPRSIYARIATL